MTEAIAEHPTSGRRRRYKSPPVLHDAFALPVPRLADHIHTENGPSDEEGEKEAKRQRSEPTTPISTSNRLPHEYDEVMGITQVDPREADSVEEELDLEYHDASENPSVPEPPDLVPKPDFSHGGCGSSSLRECVELLNNTEPLLPSTLGSRRRIDPTRDKSYKRREWEAECLILAALVATFARRRVAISELDTPLPALWRDLHNGRSSSTYLKDMAVVVKDEVESIPGRGNLPAFWSMETTRLLQVPPGPLRQLEDHLALAAKLEKFVEQMQDRYPIASDLSRLHGQHRGGFCSVLLPKET